ncbi:MAG: LytTR family transcriptional regulator [Bacteroidaceae bacterium]|nr:LytTR family transcriptional regulator [Bacteroidaceae bacterium]
MNKIPDYMFTRKFLFLTVLFIVAFSILFLQLYSPFSSTYWFTLRDNYMLLGTATMYAFSVLFLLSSKVLLIELNRKYGIGIWGLILFSIAEVLIVSIIYISITMLVKQNGATLGELVPRAIFCIFLILVIPYIIAYLFGYAHGLKMQSGKTEPKHDGTLMVSIHDNNGKIKLSLRIMDILYAVSEDNYVKIFYEQDGTVRNSMIRTTAKNIEDDLEGHITRCHRSYLINIAKVKFYNNDRDNLYVILDQDGVNPIPVSRSYRDTITSLLSSKA